MPSRLQRKRTRGYRAPPGAVYVGRPTVFGNPFRTVLISREQCVAAFRSWLADDSGRLGHEEQRRRLLERLSELRGKDLMCWCRPGDACHADVLLEIANQ